MSQQGSDKEGAETPKEGSLEEKMWEDARRIAQFGDRHGVNRDQLTHMILDSLMDFHRKGTDALREERDRYQKALENISLSLRLTWFTKENARVIAKEALKGGAKE